MNGRGLHTYANVEVCQEKCNRIVIFLCMQFKSPHSCSPLTLILKLREIDSS